MLEILPEGSLTSSVVMTTWVGVCVLSFFNLRFGWSLSGLVVPGYLVPLLLVKPWAAVVITGEAVTTYLIVLLLSEKVSRAGLWNSFFGRDRFFAIILVSIAVRLGFDGWLLPQIGEAVNAAFGLAFDYRNQLHSFGLVIVALMANQFWKPGLIRGAFPAAVTIGLSFLLVRFGLLEFTNFRMSDLSFMYEELASSILASPKAYIILVVTAFLASRMNLTYGWEFNGILIPALIALQWWQPWKVAASFVEAFAIYGLASLVLQLPVFANVTVAGARKLLLFFNIALAYKLALGWGLAIFAPLVKATDYFAFGYLLSTLLAIKMHDKQMLAVLTRATLQTSLIGAALATVLGFALTLLPEGPLPDRRAATGEARIATRASLADYVDEAAVGAYGAGLDRPLSRPSPAEIGNLTTAAERLIAAGRRGGADALERAAAAFAPLDYRVVRLGDRHIAAVDAQPERGWSSLIVRTGPAADLVVEVPDPLAAGQLAAASLALYEDADGRALILAGSSRSAHGEAALATRTDVQTAFHAFHRAAAAQNVLQLRGTGGDDSSATAPDASRLIVKARLPETLSVRDLARRLPGLDVRFGETPGVNVQRQAMRAGFAELHIGSEGTARLLQDDRGPPAAPAPRLGTGALADVFADGPGRVAEAGQGGYRPPALGELLFLDREILTPLLAAAKTGRTSQGWTDRARRTLTRVRSAAAAFGYRLARLDTADVPVLLLLERAGGARGWGTVVIRAGPAAPLGVQIPRPLAEPGTLTAGIALFRQTGARGLLVPGAHPQAVPDRAADVLRPDNAATPFNLVSQVLYREAGRAPFTAVQLRGFAPRPAAGAGGSPDVVVAAGDGSTRTEDLPAVGRRAVDALGVRDRMTFADGRPAVAGLTVGFTPQAAYLDQTENASFLTLWLSRSARQRYADKREAGLEAAHFKALDMTDKRADVVASLAGTRMVAAPPGLSAAVRNYVSSRDIMALARLQQKWPDLRFARRVDTQSRQSFLLAWRETGALALVASLAADGGQPAQTVEAGPLAASALRALRRAYGGVLEATAAR